MQPLFKKILCFSIIAIVIYQITKTTVVKPLYAKHNVSAPRLDADANSYMNANANANANASRFQQSDIVVDRLPLVEENTTILPANQITNMNYKDCNEHTVEKELYANDSPLFSEKGPTNLAPIDINDSTHRRVNFY